MREYLKKLREVNNLTQSEAAKKIGVTQQMYGFIENGHRQSKMDLPTMSKLATAFGVPLEQILQEEMKLQSTTN